MRKTFRDDARAPIRFGIALIALTVVCSALPVQNRPDARPALLRNFFLSHHCALNSYNADFLEAADTNHLDWRLLPSLAVVESGCIARNGTNNLFGWRSGKARFPSIQAGIRRVAARLATSRIYAGREVQQMLRIYNYGHRRYAGRVLAVMNSLSPNRNLVAEDTGKPDFNFAGLQ